VARFQDHRGRMTSFGEGEARSSPFLVPP
jgi:hypothetical protein